MKTYQLKDKIQITKDYVENVAEKGWQEIKNLQNQVSNIEVKSINAGKFIQLLNNLITSYYVFVGGLETLASEPMAQVTDNFETKIDDIDNIIEEPVSQETKAQDDKRILSVDYDTEFDDAVSEPFEYLVDFDEPIGDPISDEDLYGKN